MYNSVIPLLMSKPLKKEKLIAIRLDEKLLKQLKSTAAVKDRSVSWIIRDILEQWYNPETR